MRLWSIHPKYLDTKGLVALWREGLLAKKVLVNQTRGYRNHPQLNRFKECSRPQTYINIYLHLVCDEADRRGYSFDRKKLEKRKTITKKIPLKSGQIDFEMRHLMNKLKIRSNKDYKNLKSIVKPNLHPLFKKVRGGIETWEVLLTNLP
jgi:hypothetical protein